MTAIFSLPTPPDMPEWLASVHHDGSPRYVVPQHRGSLALGDPVLLRLRHTRDAPVTRVFLRTCPDGEQSFSEMQKRDAGGPSVWWETTVRLAMPSMGYRFLLLTPDGQWWYAGTGLHRFTPTDNNDFRVLAGYQRPSWITDSVVYQIVPDRFAIGDPTVGVRDGEFSYRGKSSQRRAWLEKPSADWSDAHLEFYGGDLKGIESKLDYLAELGTNAVYLTPVFTAFSSHRYDVVDYDHVDAHLGGDRALSSLRTAMATREMRLILDIVPNHCGVLHPWFQDAIADPAAPSAEFFRFIHYPDAYACWMGHRTLPKLDYRSGRLRDLMYRGANGIFRKWLRAPYSIDGWRVDVANMLARDGEVQLGTEVAREIRRAVKEENPSAYLLAEHFFDGTQTLQGDCWDGTMNYAGFTHPLWNWLMPWTIRQHDEPRLIRDGLAIGTTELLRTWESFRAAVPWTVASQQLNLLCSHDTPRIGTILQRNRSLETLAAGLLITYVGAPCLLYGTETGLLGEETGVLQCMPWDRSAWDMELFSLYRRLVGCRRSSRALREGGFQVLAADNDGFAFLRDTEDDLAIVVAHRGPAERPASVLQVMQGAVEDGTLFRELFTGTLRTVSEGHLTIPPSPPGIQIWLST